MWKERFYIFLFVWESLNPILDVVYSLNKKKSGFKNFVYFLYFQTLKGFMKLFFSKWVKISSRFFAKLYLNYKTTSVNYKMKVDKLYILFKDKV